MTHSLNERVLAIAAVFQAAELVRRTAREGRRIDDPVSTCLRSLFVIDADSVQGIYQHSQHLSLGLNILKQQLGQQTVKPDTDIPRYVISLLHLEKKCSRDQAMLSNLSQGIERIREQVDFFDINHDSVIAALADLYQQTISTLVPKIMVSGDPECLNVPDNAHLIRALLLSGIRSAMAWRQCGGSRWHLLFKRKAILQEAEKILENLPVIDTRV